MWIEVKPKELKISDWLPGEEAFARARESWAARDDLVLDHDHLVFDELNQHLLNGRLMSAVVLIPRTGCVGIGGGHALNRDIAKRMIEGVIDKVGKQQEHFFPEREYWRQEGLKQLLVDRDRMPEFRWKAIRTADDLVDYQPLRLSKFGSLRWEDIGKPIVSIPGRVFIRRAEFDVLYPPTKTEAEPSPSPSPAVRVAGIVWAKRIAERMKADGAIPEGIKRETFAETIVKRMREETAANPSLGKPYTAGHVRNELKNWGLWPPKVIK
jgi:hypothetical protein